MNNSETTVARCDVTRGIFANSHIFSETLYHHGSQTRNTFSLQNRYKLRQKWVTQETLSVEVAPKFPTCRSVQMGGNEEIGESRHDAYISHAAPKLLPFRTKRGWKL
jgi:hypothetical protein